MWGEVDMLYIDPEECIDCDACVEACPVDAIFPEDHMAGPPTSWTFASLARKISLDCDCL